MRMSEQLEIWGVKDPNISAQLALAVQLDLFKREAGLDVTCRFIESGTTMPDDILNAARPPFAFAQTPITSLLLHDRGFSTKILAPLADIAGTQQVIIRESSGVSHPQSLEGKRVGMAQRAAVYLALEKMARDCNVDLRQVQFVHLLPHEQVAAFAAQTLDAMACWEPWTTKARAAGGKLYFSGTRSEIPGMEGDINWLINQSCLIVPDDTLATKPDEVIAVLNILRKATDLINHYRKEISKELADFFGLSRIELMLAMRENNYSLSIDNLFRMGILELRDFLCDHGRLSTTFPEAQLVAPQFLRQVDPSLVLLEHTEAEKVNIIGKTGIYYRENLSLLGNDAQLTFLVADDSRFVRAALAKTVSIIGGEVVGEATTGSEVIDMFARLRPRFITMDLSMPGVSGVDAISSILQIDPDVNIIVVSGADLQEVREEVFELGVKIFITKPFDPLQAAEIIGLLLL
jgi:ABC-type nitrate/sulfonate/bicarbonate transport system substrate-binding protein/CheY-like chemotaxis protein